MPFRPSCATLSHLHHRADLVSLEDGSVAAGSVTDEILSRAFAEITTREYDRRIRPHVAHRLKDAVVNIVEVCPCIRS